MKQTSTEFKTLAENPYGARYHIRISDNGTDITQDINDFKFEHTINDDDVFLFGNTASALVTFSIIEPTVNLHGKEITIYQGINVNGTIQEIKQGVFKVLKPKKTRDKTEYQAVDRMTYLMNTPYLSELSYPTTDVAILNEICDQTSIVLANSSLVSHRVDKILNGYTKREIIAYLSQLQGKNAIINSDGNLELLWYNEVDYTIDDNKIYYDGISDVNSETNYTLGYIECTVRNEDGSEETVLRTGNGVTGVRITNPLMTQAILDEVFGVIGGFSFMPAEFEFLGDFRLEVGDIVTVETNDTTYKVPIMQLTHKSDGGVVTTVASIAETDSENEIDMTSPAIKAMDRYYANLVLINQALIGKLSADEADIRYVQTEQLDVIEANVANAVIGNLSSDFADIKLANIDIADIGKFFADCGLIDRATIKDGHITGYLDAVEINANKITAGTLIADRILLSGGNKGVLYALNNLGELTSTNVNSLDGYVLTDRTITADKIIAKSITTNELDVNQIFGNEAVLNKLVSQEIFSDAVATNTVVVGVSKDAKDALDLANSTNTASGSPILLTDSADGTLIDFKAYGRSTQDGTPTPDAPIEIESVADDGTLEVKSTGKNLLPYPYQRTTSTINGITYTDNGDGSITMNGTATADSIFLLSPVSLKAGNYTLSVDDSGFNTYYCNFQLSNTDKNIWWGFANTTSSTGVRTYTLEEDLLFNYNRLLVKAGHTMDNVTWKPMVRRAEVTDDTYEPYKSSSISIPLAEPLRSIGDVKDEIACVDGVYGVIRKIGIKLFDGVNLCCTYVSTTNYADKNIVQMNLGSTVDWSDSVEIAKSNMFMCDKFTPTYAGTNYVEKYKAYKVVSGNKVLVCYIPSELGITNTTQANTWLKSNNVTVQYILAEEVFEPFENQALFDNIATYDNVTFITATDNAEMEVEYYRNTSTGIQLAKLAGIEQDNSRLLANWASDNDITLIDGAKIYTGSITAKSIDIADLFADTAFINALSTNSIIVGATNKAEQAINSVSKTVKGITIHYLATTANSGVTTSTSGWTTTVQQIDATKKYLWTYQTITYVDNTTTNTNPVISGVYGNEGKDGKDGEDGTNGVGITSVIPLYYLKSNTTAPSAPTSAITSTSTGSGVWTTAIPKYVSGYTYFTCTQTQYTNGTYGWSTVVADNALTNANKTATTANTTANTANTNATTANTNALNAIDTANTASTNATTALNRATYHYGTCSTAAGTVAKVVTLSGFELYTGAQVTVQFTNANTASNPTLNVNGTGAKNIRVNNANISAKYYWKANNTVTFVYNGTYWVMSDTSANTIIANWCSSNDVTYIDGGKIYTGSITADKINVTDLFSQSIIATGSITGAKLYGTYAEIDEGNIGNWHINDGNMVSLTNDIIFRSTGALDYDLSDVVSTGPYGMSTYVTNGKEKVTLSAGGDNVYLEFANVDDRERNTMAYQINMYGIEKTLWSSDFTTSTTKVILGYLDDGIYTPNLSADRADILSVYAQNLYLANLEGRNATFSNTVTAPTFSGALSGTATNASKLGGKSLLAKNSTDTWDGIPFVDDKGVMEIGRYIDFHSTDGNTADYDVRITATTTGLTLSGTTSGTFSGTVYANNIIMPNNSAILFKNTLDTEINCLCMGINNVLYLGLDAERIVIGKALQGTNFNCGIQFTYASDNSKLSITPENVSNYATYLGDATYYYNTIYYQTLSQISDRNSKKDIFDISEKYLELWDKLSVKTFRYIDDDKTVKVGLIAQEVEECALKSGLSLEQCGFILREYVDNEIYKGYRYSLDYTGIATITMAKLKQVVDVINTLQDEIAVLKATVLHLQQK